MTTINETTDEIPADKSANKTAVEAIDPAVLRSSGNAVAQCTWNMSDVAEYMNAGAVFVKQLLKGLGCSDNELSPFLKVKWEKTEICFQKLHQLVRQYRANTYEGEAEVTARVMTTDVLDEHEETLGRQERMRDMLLKALLQEEKILQENDLSDVQSIDSVACLEDDSSIDSIDDLDNFLIVEEENNTLGIMVSEEDLYHRVMWKTLSVMSSLEAMGFVSLISDAMSQLGMHERGKGVDSIDTKQKTLILRWMVDRAPSNMNSLSPDEKLQGM